MRGTNFTEESLWMLIPEPLKTAQKEWFGLIHLDHAGRLSPLIVHQMGDKNQIHIDGALLLQSILNDQPRTTFVFHNHPSGNAKPSSEDVRFTRHLRKCLWRFGITLGGHWIVTQKTLYRVPEFRHS